MGSVSWGLLAVALAASAAVLTAPFCVGITDPRDVSAINGLYRSLGSPPLVGWTPVGGDPCGELWQGVSCVFSNITELRLNSLNLGGVIGESIVDFASIIIIDFGNNHIGGTIPSNLPLTVRNLSLSGNQLNGSIPGTLSMLTQLLQLSLNDNHLSEEIPDSFQELRSLISLDLSGNNLSGQLPPSLGNLSSLNFLNLQNNKLSGVLDVLQGLPLLDLDIENNLFSGPIPAKLLTIPNFRKDGNPFNTTVLPSPPAAFPPVIEGAQSPGGRSWEQANAPSIPEITESTGTKRFWTSERIAFIAASGLAVLFVFLVGLLVWRCLRGHVNKNNMKSREGEFKETMEKPKLRDESSFQPSYRAQEAPEEAVMKPVDECVVESGSTATGSKQPDEHMIYLNRMPASLRHKKDHEAGVRAGEVKSMRLQPPVSSSLLTSVKEVAVNPVNSVGTDSLRSVFTIAALQQYTGSFAEDNLIGQGTLGSVYRAELPDGKLLAVKKLDTNASRWQTDEEFLQLVSVIAKLKHPNIVELMGYCNEHGQRLLVYQYCKNGSLYNALHVDDETHKKLSWNERIRVALGAARALQYLHEVCQPPIVHQNLKSANVLLDDKFVAHISECGLAPLLSFASASQLSEQLPVSYGSSEFESGSYTCQSDVYSLGVVMLELLTGRKPFDRSRPRVERYLVGWAIPQLHDIDALSRMVDPSLNGAYPAKSLSRFADIISQCVQPEPGFRPLISEIIQDLLHMV